jgi:GDP-L-fucose synthase
MEKNSKIFVAGGYRGLLGSAIVRQLKKHGYDNVLAPSRLELDLTNQAAVNHWFLQEQPEYVFMCAAKLNGITSTDWGETMLWNLQIQTNVFDAARRNSCKKFLFPGSSCAYPKVSQLPITEDQLLTGKLESTSEGYAIAKIAGIKMGEYFRKQWGFDVITVMPCNLYGPNDTFHEADSHVMSDLILKFVVATEKKLPIVELWGNGTQLREFLYADDAADACIKCMNSYSDAAPINITSGKELSLLELAALLKQITGYQGNIIWDTTKPSGTQSKKLDNKKISLLGWTPTHSLNDGVTLAIKWFKENFDYNNI